MIGALEENNRVLQESYKEITKNEVRFDEYMMDDAEVMLVAYGTTARLCRDVVRAFRKDGKKVGLLRPISLWPFPTDIIAEYAQKLRFAMVVEMSAGQMIEDVKLACNGAIPIEFCGRTGGGVPSIDQIYSELSELL